MWEYFIGFALHRVTRKKKKKKWNVVILSVSIEYTIKSSIYLPTKLRSWSVPIYKICIVFWFFTNKQKSEIEKVQRRAARYTTGRFHNTSSVTSILDHLEWNSLETCRNIAKVTMLYKITHNLVAINPDFYISSQTSLTRHRHTCNLQYKPFSTSTDYFKFSFFPHTIVIWNAFIYHLILSLLLLWISLNHRSKQFSILYISKYITFLCLFLFCLLINCKYMVCSRRCIVVTIDGASYDVDVPTFVPLSLSRNLSLRLLLTPAHKIYIYFLKYWAVDVDVEAKVLCHYY